MKLFVHTVYVNNDKLSIADQLRGYFRGQWVCINGMKARIVNHIGSRVVVMLKGSGMIAVFP